MNIRDVPHEGGGTSAKREAALALGELGDARALPALQGVEHDADPEVRKAVRIAIGQLRRVSP